MSNQKMNFRRFYNDHSQMVIDLLRERILDYLTFDHVCSLRRVCKLFCKIIMRHHVVKSYFFPGDFKSGENETSKTVSDEDILILLHTLKFQTYNFWRNDQRLLREFLLNLDEDRHNQQLDTVKVSLPDFGEDQLHLLTEIGRYKKIGTLEVYSLFRVSDYSSDPLDLAKYPPFENVLFLRRILERSEVDSLVLRFIIFQTSRASGSFPRQYVPTVFDNYTSRVDVNGKRINVSLWDTAGQEDYDTLRPLSYQETDVFLVCFSVVNRTSFENVKHKWMDEVSQYSPESQFILVGTKSDLRREEPRNGRPHVTKAEAERLAKELKMYSYCETSSLLNRGLKEAFDTAFMSLMFSKSGKSSSSSSKGGGGWFSGLFGKSKTDSLGHLKPVAPVMPEAGRAPFLNVDESTYVKDLEKLWKNEDDVSDITIVTKDEIGKEKTTSFHAHRIVLSVASPYFKHLFGKYEYNNEDRKLVEFESEEFVKCFNLEEKTIYITNHVSSEIFKFLFEFYYLGNFVKSVPNKKQRKEIRDLVTQGKYFPSEEDFKVKEDLCKILDNLEEMEKPALQEEERNFFQAINYSLQTYLIDERSEEYKKYYDDEEYSDVVFCFTKKEKDVIEILTDEEEGESEEEEKEKDSEEGKKQVHLHKAMLFCRSEYFKTMLTSNFIESRQKEVEILEETNIHDEIQYFITYLYTSHTYDFITDVNALQMLSLGNKYGNRRLITFCEIYVSKLVEKECSEQIEKSAIDVIGILIFADHHRAEQLKKFCLHFIASNYQCFRRRKEWEDLVQEKELHDYVEKNQWPPKTYLRDVKKYQKELHEYYKKIGKKVPKKDINFLKEEVLKDIEKYEYNGEEDDVEKLTKKNLKVNGKKKSKGLFGFLFGVF